MNVVVIAIILTLLLLLTILWRRWLRSVRAADIRTYPSTPRSLSIVCQLELNLQYARACGPLLSYGYPIELATEIVLKSIFRSLPMRIAFSLIGLFDDVGDLPTC